APKVQAVHGSDIEPDLAAAGWSPDPTHAAGALVSVQVGPLNHGTAAEGAVTEHPGPSWWELAIGTRTPTTTQRRVVTSTPPPQHIGYCTIEADGTVVGAARGAIVDDMLYLSNLAVRPTHRRKGLAQGILNTLGDWGHAHGATAYVLQVAATNTAANTLYARRDFTESHRYRYWI